MAKFQNIRALTSTLARPRLTSTLSVTDATNVSPKPFKEMPTEKGSSLVFGVGPDLAKDSINQMKFYRDLGEKHGKLFRMKVGPRKYLVVIGNPEDAEVVMKMEGKYPSRGDGFVTLGIIVDSVMGHNASSNMVVTSEGPQWKAVRSVLNPVVMPRKLGKHVKRLDEVSSTFLNVVKESTEKDGFSRDLMEFIPFWSAEAISRFLYPKPIYFQKNRDQRAMDLMEGLRDVIQSLSASYYPKFILKYFPVRAVKKGIEGFKKLKTTSLGIIKEMETGKDTFFEDSAEGTFLEQWMAQGLTYDVILANVADFLAAGTDTTANTTAFILHMLAKNPDVQEKAHNEVVSVVGKDGIITDEALQKLSYIKAIQKETARFKALGAAAVIRVVSDDLVIGGYKIPAKTLITVSSAIMNHDSAIFENPEEFRPERWLRDSTNRKKMRNQQIAAGIFGFGPRMCLGRRLAELEMWSLLAKMMQKTRMELHPDSVDLQAVGPIVQKLNRPLRVKLHFMN